MDKELDRYLHLKQKRIILGGDHHSRDVVRAIERHLTEKGVSFELVPFDDEHSDYIAQSSTVAQTVSESNGDYCGIVGCKNGFGVTSVCNMYKNVFATRCDTPEQALDARRVNYCNVLTFGAVFVDEEEIKQIVNNWLDTDFELDSKNLGRLERLFKLQAES
jgi:RpiB/LacA/LacB family sugar-phosphate isomerase